MRKLLSVLSVLFIAQFAHADNSILITDAIGQNYVSASIKGRDSIPTSTFGDIIVVKLRNVRDDSLIIKVVPGLKLVSNRAKTMTTAKTQKIFLRPKEEITDTIFCFSIEKSRRLAPSKYTIYNFGVFDTENQEEKKMVDLIRYLDRNNFHNQSGQSAIYVLQGKLPVSSVFGKDARAVNKLRVWLARSTGERVVEYADQRIFFDHSRAKTASSYYGAIRYTVLKPSQIVINLYDGNDMLVDTIDSYQKTNLGGYTYNFRISETDIREGLAFIRLFVNGDMAQEVVFDFNNVIDRRATLRKEEDPIIIPKDFKKR